MTRKQAQHLMYDWGNELLPTDFCETVYLSIKGIGTKTFKDCCYHDSEGYIFIWTKEESIMIKKKDLGDFVSIPDNKKIILSLKKVT